MAQKFRGEILIPNLKDGLSVVASEPGTGIVLDDKPVLPRRCRLTLSGATLTVLEANDYGSLKLLDLPDRNVMILGVEVDLVLTKQGNTNGIVAATDLDVGVGSAAASNTTLSGAMIDVLEKADIDTDALAVDYEAVMVGQSTAKPPVCLADSASLALYLNAVAVAGITADSSLSVSGTVDIFYLDLGNKAS